MNEWIRCFLVDLLLKNYNIDESTRKTWNCNSCCQKIHAGLGIGRHVWKTFFLNTWRFTYRRYGRIDNSQGTDLKKSKHGIYLQNSKLIGLLNITNLHQNLHDICVHKANIIISFLSSSNVFLICLLTQKMRFFRFIWWQKDRYRKINRFKHNIHS